MTYHLQQQDEIQLSKTETGLWIIQIDGLGERTRIYIANMYIDNFLDVLKLEIQEGEVINEMV